MNKLFRKVKSSDRRPKKNDTYATSRGDCLYHVNLDGFVNDMGFRIMPEYWYEPVEIPTDGEIEKIIESTYPATCKDKELFYHFSFYFGGFEAAINHLTGGK